MREAFAKAKAFKPKLTRYERQQILQKTAELLRDRKEEFARLITAESGLCWKDSLYEASRAYDVWSFAAQLTIKDDGEILCLRHLAERQGAQDLHDAHSRCSA